MGALVATVLVFDDGVIAKVHSPYDRNRVDVIKAMPARSWDSATKTWTIPSIYVGTLKVALEAIGDAVVVTGRPAAAPGDSARHEADRRSWNAERTRLERDRQRLQQEVNRLRSTAAAASGQDWAEQLLGKLTPEQADKAYRALVRVLHPDVGGDHRLMQQLNVARDLYSARSGR